MFTKIKEDLLKQQRPSKAEFHLRFFKCGKGFSFIELINFVESLNVLICGLNITLKFDFNNISISLIPHFSRRLLSP